MRSCLILFTLTFLFQTIFAQTSTVLMQRCLGDSSNTILYCTIKTSDGGYISGGWVSANNGDVSGYKGGKDGWIVKLNQLGGIEWQRCLGGSKSDEVYDIIQTSDSGFVVAGQPLPMTVTLVQHTVMPALLLQMLFSQSLMQADSCYG